MGTSSHDQVPPSTSAPADSWFWRFADRHPVALLIGAVLFAALVFFLFPLPAGQQLNPV